MQNAAHGKRILAAGILVAACLLAAVYSLILLQSVDIGVVAGTVGSALIVLSIEPFYGLVYFVLLNYINPYEFIPALRGVPLALVTGMATFAAMWFRITLRGGRIPIFRAPQDYLIVWFTLAIIISPLARLDPEGSVSAAHLWMVNVVLYFLVTGLVTTKARLRTMLHVLVIASLWLAIQGLIMYYTGAGISDALDADKRIEVVGAGDPNNLAFHLILVIPFLYALIFEAKSGFTRLWGLTVFLLITAAIYFTNSRGGALSYAAIMAFIVGRRHGLVLGLLFAVVAAAATFALGPSRVRELSATEPSAAGRILMWKESFRMLQSYPLFGVGAGKFSQAAGLDKVAHNSFLSCAAELGLFGLLAWVLLIYTSARNAFYVSRCAVGRGFGQMSLYAGAIAFGLLAYLLAGMFLSKTYSMLLTIFVGLSVAATNIFVDKSQETYRLFEKRDLLCGILLMIGGLVFFKVLLAVV